MNRDVPQDPISGNRAIHEGDRRDVSEMSSREIEEEITHTRAHMSSTLNAIEARVSPARLKHEVRSTIDEAVDKYSPQRLAQKAGDNMLDAIKDHPVPAIIAGLSIGYIFMKGSDDDDRYGRRSSERDYRHMPYSSARGQSMYRDDVYPSRHPQYPAQYPDEGDGSSDVRQRASDAASDVRDYADEKMHDARDLAGDVISDAGHRARDMGRTARRSARRAEHRVEEFVQGSPLLAGLVAAGAGALLGSLLPSTRFEDEQVGPYRDDLVDQASDMADEVRERAGRVAEDARHEMKESGERIVESAQSEAKDMQNAHDGSQSGRSGMSAEARQTERRPIR